MAPSSRLILPEEHRLGMVDIADSGARQAETGADLSSARQRLSIPVFRQEKDSTACGLYCLKMLYQYYGCHHEVVDIAAELELIPTGVYAQELGCHLLRHGFLVTLITRDTSRFPLSYGRLSDIQLRAAISSRLSGSADGSKERAFWRGLLHFLSAGGNLVWAEPSIEETLLPALQHDRPVIVCLDAKALYQRHDLADGTVDPESSGQAGHYVVVTAVDEQTVTIADPSAVFGGVNGYSRQRFLYAWYSFQGYALLAEPREELMT